MSELKPTTPRQSGILQFLGAAAPATSMEAHWKITELMAVDANRRRWIAERARRCVAAMRPAVSGQNGHDATFAVACALVHGFALDAGDALMAMRDYNTRCDPPWTERQLAHKIETALTWPRHDEPRGHLLGDDVRAPLPSVRASTAPTPLPATVVKKTVEFNPEKLRSMAAGWRDVVNLPWLANRSAVDPCLVSPADFLKLLYKPGEKVWVAENDYGRNQAMWPGAEIPTSSEDGVKFLAQPVDGNAHHNPRQGTMSARSQEAVVEFRYILVESDEADFRDWMGLLVQLPLRVEAIYGSGGKSVHALVRVDQPTKAAWDHYREKTLAPTINLLCLGGLDPKVLTAVRLTRLPNCWRGGKQQKLLYVRPNAPIQPICEMRAERDVVADWCGAASMGPSDSDETGEGARMVRRALDFYGPAAMACRSALATFNAACEAAQFDLGK